MLHRLLLCSAVRKFFTTNKRSGVCEGENKKNKKGINAREGEENEELSDFDKKYYSLVKKGLVSREHYEESRLLFLLYTETSP